MRYAMSKKQQNLLSRAIVPMFIGLMLISCEKNYILDENKILKDYKWEYADSKTFIAEIMDTTLQYDIYINLRHSADFEWRNVWVKIETTFPDGREFERRVNLVLGEADGHWLGSCLSDNCDIHIPIQQAAHFPLTGKYTFKLSQDMRVNPLVAIKSVGVEILKEKK
ncbi:MAG: gliding motility lipoprotein GldH [Bacteroidetes bacterium]|nr:gliding motility lipoprotein GldH [Bacteroidota bacterium]